METIPNVGTVIQTQLPPTEDKHGFIPVAHKLFLGIAEAKIQRPKMPPDEYLEVISPFINWVCGTKKSEELFKKLEAYTKESLEDINKINVFNDPSISEKLATKRALDRILNEANDYFKKTKHNDGYPVSIGVLGEEGYNVDKKPIRFVSEKVLRRIADARKIREVPTDEDGIIEEDKTYDEEDEE